MFANPSLATVYGVRCALLVICSVSAMLLALTCVLLNIWVMLMYLV
jgi:hypothetical protein